MTTLAPRPQVAPPASWSFPVPQRWTLPNGLTVLAFDRPGQHVISAALTMDVPLAAEPRGREGVATVWAQALDQGTATHPGTTFAEAVESAGAVLSVGVDHAATQVYMDVPASHLAAGLTLMAEAVREPLFAETDVTRERDVVLAELDQADANPSALADRRFSGVLYPEDSRLSRRMSGERETLAQVTDADVRAYHAAHMGPRDATLILAGQLGDVASAVEDAFGAWANPVQTLLLVPTPGVTPRRLVLVDRPGAVQSDVRFGVRTIDRTDARWAALQVGAYALGGAFMSRLNATLREDKGFTYGVHLRNAPVRGAGFSAVGGSFRTEVTAEAIAMMPGLLDVSERPIDADEVRRAVDYLNGVQPLVYATASGVCNGAATLVSAGLQPSFVDDLRAAIASVTPDQATAAASELLRAEAMSLVVVGDAERVEPGLREAGFEVEVLSENA